ncbi:probable 2' cyclic ADP-D-ribose synthase BdTIR [Malania oleifera]|uniref:probable 2' cyclic ADP-D-ribose synthase BdTIR n=1 Tax=Malania oleifera TaxID=397392 RepID=UPI0025ADAB0C|nr:probable 2' cyclic ADP-D-ribose synthase BdTIR [Malania oleifera]
MQRLPAKTMCRQVLLRHRPQIQEVRQPCDVFISHRSIDTKRTVAGLLYDHLRSNLGLRPFLDSKNMKPGDKLFDTIDPAIRDCKVGIAVFSPRYCHSYFCLHELALLMDSKKRVIPVFCDVKPSELRVRDDGSCPKKELQRFSWALEEAKYTVGLTFDTCKGDWAEFLRSASDALLKNLVEVEGDRLDCRLHKRLN